MELCQIGRNRTFLSHSSCIWDVSILPRPQRVPAPHLISDKDCVPGGAFATGSADGTIRLWYLGSEQEGFNPGMNSTPSPTPQSTNVYSKDILGVLYIGQLSSFAGPWGLFCNVDFCLQHFQDYLQLSASLSTSSCPHY